MYRFKVPVGRLEVTVGALCPNEAQEYGLSSWSLLLIQTQLDIDKQKHLATGLRATLCRMGVHMAYAPNISEASARIVCSDKLKEQVRLGDNIVLHRNLSVPADGVFIGRGHAFVASGAGCPIIVAVAGEQMVVAHAGRDSLIDRGAAVGKPSRNHLSVVDAIADAFVERGALLGEIVMCMQFAIPMGVFEHRLDDSQVGAPYNRALAKFVDERWPGSTWRNGTSMFLDLESVFEKQAREAGIKNVSAMNSLAEFPTLAHTRDGKGERRNLIVIKRNQESA